MRRLPVNLATHPVEAVRRARRWMGAAALLLVLLSGLHLLVARQLATALGPPPPDPSREGEALADWGRELAGLAAAAEPRRAQRVAEAVAAVNELLARRSVPWNELFAVLEATLPGDVRLELVQPLRQPEGVRVSLVAASPSRDALQRFLTELEARAEFEAVYPVRMQEGTDGHHRLTLEARHRGGGP